MPTFKTPGAPLEADAAGCAHITHASRIWALVPCAGHGARAGAGELAKQYRHVAGRAVVSHTLDALAAVPRIDAGLVVISPNDDFFKKTAPIPHGWTLAACGGATRAASVTNGLSTLIEQGARPDDWVLVHDAARCLVTPALVDALIDACIGDAVGGLLAVPLADTLKFGAQGRALRTETRADKWLAQTPQMFRIGALRTALEVAGDTATDEASAMEAMGDCPLLVPGSAHNLKVTWPEDFALADALLRMRQASAAAVGVTPDSTVSSHHPEHQGD